MQGKVLDSGFGANRYVLDQALHLNSSLSCRYAPKTAVLVYRPSGFWPLVLVPVAGLLALVTHTGFLFGGLIIILGLGIAWAIWSRCRIYRLNVSTVQLESRLMSFYSRKVLRIPYSSSLKVVDWVNASSTRGRPEFGLLLGAEDNGETIWLALLRSHDEKAIEEIGQKLANTCGLVLK